MFFSTASYGTSCQQLAVLALLATSVCAHTWIEQMQIIGSNGSYVGDYGYPRGYVERNASPDYGFANKWQLPIPDETSEGRIHVNSSDMICHTAQRTANYSDAFPMLNVVPGSWVAAKYYENGHVTQPWIPAGKPEAGGTVWVYATYEPSSTEKLVDVLQWTEDGKGGNGKGWLIATNDFDDGRCHQISDYPIAIQRQMEFPNHVPGQPMSNVEQLCETNFQIPPNAQTGKPLTAYWVWSWQTSSHTNGAPCGKDEYYTTCMDLNIVGGAEDKLAAASKVHTIGQQDAQPTAVSTYMSRTAIASKPNLITTQGCNITSITSHSIPASLTVPTSLPSSFLATEGSSSNVAYNTPAPTTPSTPAATATPSAPVYSAPTPVISSSSSSSTISASTITSTMISVTSSMQNATMTSTTPSSSASTSSNSIIPSSSLSSSPSVGFKTSTIYGNATSSDPATASPTAGEAIVRIGSNNVVELGKRSGVTSRGHARSFVHLAA